VETERYTKLIITCTNRSIDLAGFRHCGPVTVCECGCDTVHFPCIEGLVLGKFIAWPSGNGGHVEVKYAPWHIVNPAIYWRYHDLRRN
jgi:hypothetical protein